MAPATLLKNFDIKFSSQSFPFVRLLLGKEIVVVKVFQEKLIFIYFSHQFVSRCSLAKEISVDFQNYCFLSWLYWHGRKHYRILIEITHEPLVLNYCIVIAFWSFWCIICYDKIYFAVDSNFFYIALRRGT